MIWTSSWLTELIIFILTFWVILYFYFTRKFDYWKNRNVPYVRPIPFFGNALEIFTLRKSIGDLCRNIYENTKKPFMGIFICDEPYLLVRDTNLIKTILIKDFDIFSNRTIIENKKDDALGSYMLFTLKSPEWNEIRRKVTPVFTSGKLKTMYKLISDIGEELVTYLEQEVKKNSTVDIKEVAQRYTTEIVASTSFGITANCFKDENAEFRQVSKRLFNWEILERAISTTCYFIAPTLVKLFKLKFIDSYSANFLRDVFWKTVNEREKLKFVRNDVVDILIDLKNKQRDNDAFKLEGDKMVAQAAQFIFAGYETSSSTILFTLYELAQNPDVQSRLRQEIMEVKNKHGNLSYDALKEMEYLDMCIKETLRKYPVLPFLDRRCNVDYSIPGTDVVLKKGTGIFISNWGLHFDPEYYPEPEKYDPTRFSEENLLSRPPFTYLPFGEGPRNCIGARYGVLNSKSGVAHILEKFEVELSEETQCPLKLDTKGVLLAPIRKLLLKFKQYQQKN